MSIATRPPRADIKMPWATLRQAVFTATLTATLTVSSARAASGDAPVEPALAAPTNGHGMVGPSAVTPVPPPAIPTVEIIRANLEASYLTFPVIVSGVEPLIFETKIVPHFFLTPHDWPVALALTPKVLLRMFQGPSAPVKTPSYMPRLTLFAWLDKSFDGDPLFYSSVSLNHHSNGQSGPFLNPDGTNNHETGSFATNYLEFSLYRGGWKPELFDTTSLTFEWHTPIGEELGPGNRYGRFRLRAATTVLVHLITDAKFTLEVTSILDGFERSSDNVVVRQLERFPLSAQYIAKVPGVDVGLYIGYYFGHDYYNIWFDRLANVFQVGIGSDVSSTLPRELDPGKK
jgi:hypothetical protein